VRETGVLRSALEIIGDGNAYTGKAKLNTIRFFYPRIAKQFEKAKAEGRAELKKPKIIRVAAPAILRNDGADAWQAIRAATAHLGADQDDVASLMFVALGERRLKLSEALARVGEFVKLYRYRPRALGDAYLSLDMTAGEDGCDLATSLRRDSGNNDSAVSVDQRRRAEAFFLEVLAAFFERDFFAVVFAAFFAAFLAAFLAFFFEVLGAAFLALATLLAGEALRFCFRAGKSGAGVAAASVASGM
jgi:hypothetical protein